MGYVYRLTERSYRRLLRAIAKEQEYDLDRFGTRLATEYHNVTDTTAEEAQDMLKDVLAQAKEQRERKQQQVQPQQVKP